MAKAIQSGLFGGGGGQLIPQVKVVNRGGKTHTQIYWIDPDTGIPAHKETRAGAFTAEQVGTAPKGISQGALDFDSPPPKPAPKPAPKVEPTPEPKPAPKQPSSPAEAPIPQSLLASPNYKWQASESFHEVTDGSGAIVGISTGYAMAWSYGAPLSNALHEKINERTKPTALTLQRAEEVTMPPSTGLQPLVFIGDITQRVLEQGYEGKDSFFGLLNPQTGLIMPLGDEVIQGIIGGRNLIGKHIRFAFDPEADPTKKASIFVFYDEAKPAAFSKQRLIGATKTSRLDPLSADPQGTASKPPIDMRQPMAHTGKSEVKMTHTKQEVKTFEAKPNSTIIELADKLDEFANEYIRESEHRFDGFNYGGPGMYAVGNALKQLPYDVPTKNKHKTIVAKRVASGVALKRFADQLKTLAKAGAVPPEAAKLQDMSVVLAEFDGFTDKQAGLPSVWWAKTGYALQQFDPEALKGHLAPEHIQILSGLTDNEIHPQNLDPEAAEALEAYLKTPLGKTEDDRYRKAAKTALATAKTLRRNGLLAGNKRIYLREAVEAAYRDLIIRTR